MKSKNRKPRRNKTKRIRGGVNYPDINSGYVGEVVDGKRFGKGKQTFSDGNIYDGYWVDDKMEGKGTLTFRNGDEYIGDFKKGKMDGLGTIIYNERERWALRSGDVYIGEFKDGKYNGQGIYKYNDGREYVGEFFNNMRHGQGKQTSMSPDGSYVISSYDGAWRNDSERGFGTRTESGFWESSSRNFERNTWKSDNDCENIEGIMDPVTGDKIRADRGFRLEAEKYRGNEKGRCYDAETIRRIKKDEGPLTKEKFTKKDKDRRADYVTKYPKTSDYWKKYPIGADDEEDYKDTDEVDDEDEDSDYDDDDDEDDDED